MTVTLTHTLGVFALGGVAIYPTRTATCHRERMVRRRAYVAWWLSGGLVPSPAALVLLLSAISLGRLGFGMVLVVVFSMGLAVVLTGIGLLMVYARRLFERYSFEARIPRFLPVASAATISLVGLVIVLGAVSQTGLV